MTPPNNKNKTDNWYEPDDWQLTPSEKRLIAIRTSKSHMSKKSQRKTTNVMKEEQVSALREEFKKEQSDQLKLIFSDRYDIEKEISESDVFINNNDEYTEDDIPTYRIYKDKTKNLEVFETAIDESDKTKLHSSDKDESDMIAVEPKDASNVKKIKVEMRTWWLRILQWFTWRH